jgi:hypothetical protein
MSRFKIVGETCVLVVGSRNEIVRCKRHGQFDVLACSILFGKTQTLSPDAVCPHVGAVRLPLKTVCGYAATGYTSSFASLVGVGYILSRDQVFCAAKNFGFVEASPFSWPGKPFI